METATMKKNIALVVVSILVILCSVLSGWIPWHYVAGLLVIVGLVYLTTHIPNPAWKKAAIWGIAVVTLMGLIIPLLYHQAPDPLRDALETLKDAESIRFAEKFSHPNSLPVTLLYKSCEEEKIQSIRNAITEYGEQVKNKDPLAEIKLRTALITVSEQRKKCGDVILEQLSATENGKPSEPIGIVGWLAIIIFFDLAGTTLAWAVQNPEKPESSLWIRHMTFAISIALGVYLVGDWISAQGFSMKESIKKLTAFFALDVHGLSHDIAIALTLAGIVGVVGFTAGAVNRIRKGSFPAGYIAGLSLSLFVIYQLVFTN